MNKPDWKVEFDEQVAQCGIDIADLFRDYPEAVVLEALNKELTERNTEHYREQFQDEYTSGSTSDNSTNAQRGQNRESQR